MWSFSDFQYGFRSCRSTADLLTVASDRIARAFNRFVAFNRSFDKVWHARPLHKLKSYGISGQVFGLVSSFLSNRRLRVVVDGKSSQEYPVKLGFLKALFLVLHFSNLLMMLSVIMLSILMLSTPSVNWHQLELASELESDLRDTAEWVTKWLVDFNAGKTKLVSFDRSNTAGAIDVKMDGSILEEKTSFKMLGLTFSSKLDWGSYIVSIAKTASKKIGALIRSMKFLSPDVALYLYKSTIRPCMEYCCHASAGTPSCYLGLLDKLQNWTYRTVGPSITVSLEPSSSKCSQLKSFL